MRVWTLLACTALFASAAHGETLREALASAYATNPQLEAERFQTEIARETINQARAQGRTRVALNGSAGYESTDSNVPFNFAGDRPLASAQVQAVRPIFTGGGVKAGIRQAKAGLKSAESLFSAAEQDLFRKQP